MSTITDTGVEALRARVGATLARRLDAHIERLDWDAAQLSSSSAMSCARCWSTPSSGPRFMRGAWPGSILSGSSSSNCPGCR